MHVKEHLIGFKPSASKFGHDACFQIWTKSSFLLSLKIIKYTFDSFEMFVRHERWSVSNNTEIKQMFQQSETGLVSKLSGISNLSSINHLHDFHNNHQEHSTKRSELKGFNHKQPSWFSQNQNRKLLKGGVREK